MIKYVNDDNRNMISHSFEPWPAKYSGFAFGLGIERIVMIKYGIDDIHNFYANDLRFLEEFAGTRI